LAAVILFKATTTVSRTAQAWAAARMLAALADLVKAKPDCENLF
jgi:hypothetical protein